MEMTFFDSIHSYRRAVDDVMTELVHGSVEAFHEFPSAFEMLHPLGSEFGCRFSHPFSGAR